jgi:hypothetical protein
MLKPNEQRGLINCFLLVVVMGLFAKAVGIPAIYHWCPGFWITSVVLGSWLAIGCSLYWGVVTIHRSNRGKGNDGEDAKNTDPSNQCGNCSAILKDVRACSRRVDVLTQESRILEEYVQPAPEPELYSTLEDDLRKMAKLVECRAPMQEILDCNCTPPLSNWEEKQ